MAFSKSRSSFRCINVSIKLFTVILISIFLVNISSAYCKNSQIEINSASLEKLDELTGIGPAKAQSIIDTRPFDQLEDLIDVSGIGEITLQKILDQGLACIDESDSDILEKTSQDDSSTSSEKSKTYVLDSPGSEKIAVENVINLNSNELEETIVYESKNQKLKDHSWWIFLILGISIIYILLKK